jgi:hypothetical protein
MVVEFAEIDKQGLRTPMPLWAERNRETIPWVGKEYDRIKKGQFATYEADIPPV